MKCKNLKIRTQKGHKYGYCKLYNKEVSVFCNECPFEVKYDLEKINQFHGKSLNWSKSTSLKNKSNSYQIKRKSNNLANAEKNRYSIIYQDLTKCAKCGLENGDYDARIRMYTHIDKNEVFEGSYRQSSIKYGLVVPLCTFCHGRFHSDREFALYYKRMFQDKFVESHSLDEFIKIFGKDYHYTS